MNKYDAPQQASPMEYSLYSTINPVLGTFLHERLGLTPNAVTTITLVMGVASAWLVWNDRFAAAAAVIVARQVLDSTDGFIARKYDLATENGAIYDRGSDGIALGTFLGIMAYKFRDVISKNRAIIALIAGGGYWIANAVIQHRYACIQRRAPCDNANTRDAVLRATASFSFFDLVLVQAAFMLIAQMYVRRS